MWIPRGCQKLQKVVTAQNPYPNPEGGVKTDKTEVRRNPGKSPLFRKSIKTVKITTFSTFLSSDKSVKKTRVLVGLLPKMTKMGRIIGGFDRK